MKKIFKLLFFCIGLGMLATSCGDNDDSDIVNDLTFPECFAFVEDYSSSASAYYKNVSYVVAVNYTKAKADVTVNNLKLTDGTTMASFRMKDVPVSIDSEGALLIKADQVKTDNGLGGDFAVSNLSIRIVNRFINIDGRDVYLPAFSARFKVNQHFTVTSSTPEQRLYGTTTSTMENGPAFTTKATYYEIKIDTEIRQLSIVMRKAQFIDKMPAMDITVNNIPFTLSGNTLSFSAEAKIPSIGGTPFEGFPITKLKGELDFSKGMTFSFDCRPQTMGGTLFHVNAATVYPLPDTEKK